MNVLFEERPSLHGFRIGIATLDAEKSLNAQVRTRTNTK